MTKVYELLTLINFKIIVMEFPILIVRISVNTRKLVKNNNLSSDENSLLRKK